MLPIIRKFLTVFAVIFCLAASAFIMGGLFSMKAGAADAASNGAFSEMQKAEIRQVLKDYLKENPDLVYMSLQLYQQKQEEELRKMTETRITENLDVLTAKDLPSIGNPNADVTIVEFYDYNCGYCKRAFEDIQKILDSDKNVRFVFKELAILGPTSEIAARWSTVAHKQGKFFEFHSALMKHNGGIDEKVIIETAQKVGLDMDRAKKDVESAEIKEEVNKSREVAMELKINGTPGFIVNGKLFRGYLGEEGLKTTISETRNPPGKEG